MSENLTPQSNEIKQENQSKVEISEEKPSIKSEENQVNWKKFREDKERDRKARIEAEQAKEKAIKEAEAIRQAMEALLNKNEPQQTQDEQEETHDQIIEKKVQQALQRERERIKQEQERYEKESAPRRILEQYKDFNKVCSEENIDYLEFHYPKEAKRLALIPEGFDRWEAMYEVVKEKVPYANRNNDEKRIEKNLHKPQANMPNMTDSSPTSSSSYKISEERKRENWKRMDKDRKGF